MNLIGTNITSYVFFLNYKNATGTCFLLSRKGQNYLVTAKHIFRGSNDNEQVKVNLYKDASWYELDATILFHSNPEVDIAILKSINLSTYNDAIPLKEDFNALLSDEVFFLGFPYGHYSPDNGRINSGRPIPLIKKGIFSGATVVNDVAIHILDGHNNPGFSGGPVLVKDRYISVEPTPEGELKRWSLLGVISAYVPQNGKIKTPIGEFDYTENSGLIISHGYSHIKEILNEH